jgi:hypothetical protein
VAVVVLTALVTGCGPQQYDPSQKLLQDLRSEDANRRVRAAMEVRHSIHYTPEILEELFSRLQNDPDKGVRIAIAQALRHVGQGSINRLQEILKSEREPEVQTEIVATLNALSGRDPGGQTAP